MSSPVPFLSFVVYISSCSIGKPFLKKKNPSHLIPSLHISPSSLRHSLFLDPFIVFPSSRRMFWLDPVQSTWQLTQGRFEHCMNLWRLSHDVSFMSLCLAVSVCKMVAFSSLRYTASCASQRKGIAVDMLFCNIIWWISNRFYTFMCLKIF